MMNINDLRETLSTLIEKLMNEEIDPRYANSVVNASGKVLSSVKLQMDYMKMMNKPKDIAMLAIDVESEKG